MLKAIIIDDESESLEAVSNQLKTFCPQLRIVASCDGAVSGIKAINLHQPDIIFLDIEMPGMTGLEMLGTFSEIKFGIIFITEYNKYAMDAIKLSALDYLLKPLDTVELMSAVKKAEEKFFREKTMKRFQLMLDLMEGRESTAKMNKSHTIALPMLDAIIYVQLDNIVNIDAHQSYCEFHFSNRPSILISKNIGTYEDSLVPFNFMRVHRSHIVNLSKVQEFRRTDGGILLMENGNVVSISRNKKEKVLKRLGGG